MEEQATTKRVPVYCPFCKAEWQPNATYCLGCGVKAAQCTPQSNEINPQKKVSSPQKQSGAKAGRDIEYTEKTIAINDHTTVRVYRPLLTAEERAKREKRVIDTLVAIAREGGFKNSEKE